MFSHVILFQAFTRKSCGRTPACVWTLTTSIWQEVIVFLPFLLKFENINKWKRLLSHSCTFSSFILSLPQSVRLLTGIYKGEKDSLTSVVSNENTKPPELTRETRCGEWTSELSEQWQGLTSHSLAFLLSRGFIGTRCHFFREQSAVRQASLSIISLC